MSKPISYNDHANGYRGCLVLFLIPAIILLAGVLLSRPAHALVVAYPSKVHSVYFDGFVGKKVGICSGFVADVTGFAPWKVKEAKTWQELDEMTIDRMVGVTEPIMAGDVVYYRTGETSRHIEVVSEVQDWDGLAILHVYGSNMGGNSLGYDRWIIPDTEKMIVGYAHTPMTVRKQDK